MYLRVSITDRCNLRCVYCLPAHARFAVERASPAELQELTAQLCRVLPIDKIRYTGGEPTLHPQLADFIAHGARLVGPHVGLTSNGVLLAPLLPKLRAAGLRLLNISLDATSVEDFTRLARRPGFDAVLTSIRAAKAAGYQPLKVNAVALPSTDYIGLVDLAVREGFHLRFIEVMAIGVSIAEQAAHYVSASSIRTKLFDGGISLSEEPQLDQPTSHVWTIPGVDARDTTIGFVTTSSQPFCGTCDRLRLSSLGCLHTCLFDERGVDLLEALRREDLQELERRILEAVAAKAPPARFVRHTAMASIGG